MPNPFTSLRREVLLDLLDQQKSPIPTILPPNILEAGGSFDHVAGADGTVNAGGGDTLAGMQSGEDYFTEPTTITDPNNTLYYSDLEFASVTQRFDTSDSFVSRVVSNFVYSLRVMPQGSGTNLPSPLTAISVKKTGLRPFIFGGHTYVYPGGTKDLASYVTGFPHTNCLITLTPSAIPSSTVFDSTGAAINVITNPTIVSNPANWPKTQIPLAIVYLDSTWSTAEGVTLDSIFDVRPTSWWNGSAGVAPTSFVIAAVDSLDPSRADYQCTGTNDQVIINQVLALLPAVGGEIICLAGHYSIGDTATSPRGIVITGNNVTLAGEGVGTIFQRKWNEIGIPATAVLSVGDGGTHSPTHIEMHDFAIDGISSTYISTNNHGILFNTKVSYSGINRVYIHDNGGEGVLFLSSLSTGLQNNYNRIQNCDIINNGGNGIFLNGLNQWNLIEGNFCETNTANGIKCLSSDKTRLSENSVFGNTLHGIWVESIEGGSISRNDATSNAQSGIYAFNLQQSGIQDNRLFTNTQNGLIVDSSMECSITGNTTWANVLSAARFVGGAVTGGNRHTINGNSFVDSTTMENVIFDALVNCSFTSNICTGVTALKYALRLINNSTGNAIDGNLFTGDLLAISIESGSTGNSLGSNPGSSSLTILNAAAGGVDLTAVRQTAKVTAATFGLGLATFIEADATSNAITLTLPDATLCAGRKYEIQKFDSSVHVVTLSSSLSQTIGDGGSTTRVITTQGDTLMVISDGSNWRVMASPSVIMREQVFTAADQGAWAANVDTLSGGGAQTITLSLTPVAGRPLLVFIEESRLKVGDDCTISGAVITLIDGKKPTTGQVVTVDYFA